MWNILMFVEKLRLLCIAGSTLYNEAAEAVRGVTKVIKDQIVKETEKLNKS